MSLHESGAKKPRGRVGEWEKGRKTKKEEVRDDVSGVR
jgi:hypothetical protein